MDIELIKLIVAAITSLILYFVGRNKGKKVAKTAVSLNDHLILAIEKMSASGNDDNDTPWDVAANGIKQKVRDVFAETRDEKAEEMLQNRLEHWGILKLKQQAYIARNKGIKIRNIEDSLTKQ